MALLGPPELRNPIPRPSNQSATKIHDPFMKQMAENFNQTTVAPTPPMGETENKSGTFLNSGNPCLDFFFRAVPNTKPPDDFNYWLDCAWNHNPLTTLKLICNLRGVRGTGKSDKEGFFRAACWLHSHHPKTLACNVASFAEFGCFKDLLEILYRLIEGWEVRERQKEEWRRTKGAGGKRGNGNGGNKRRSKKPAATRAIRIANSIRKDKVEKQRASALRKEKRISMAKKALKKYTSDGDFRFLYDRVSDYFAECLKNDMKLYESGEYTKISLAAKWCPSIDSSFDRAMLIGESIAKKVFPRELYPEYEGIEDAHYAYRVRNRLRKDILVTLRKVLQLPETYIGANKWNAIPYNRVPSVAMNFYKEKFLKHDPKRFTKYLKGVKPGKGNLKVMETETKTQTETGKGEKTRKGNFSAAALLPHEMIACLDDDDGGQLAEFQWKRMVGDKLSNCLAICDISDSMEGIPMKVSVALGILISELSADPWKGKLITFRDKAQLHVIEGYNLRSKTEFLRHMERDRNTDCRSPTKKDNTDFQRVFDLILKVAVDGNLKPEQMIKRLFVFSDMEFNKASANPWETDYHVIVKKFTEKGYGMAVPEIVFWNLRQSGSNSTPVSARQKGAALVSGYSKNLLSLLFDNEGELNPERIMEAAISGEEYQKLVVLD